MTTLQDFSATTITGKDQAWATTSARWCWSSTPRRSAASRPSSRASRSCTPTWRSRGSSCSASQRPVREPGVRQRQGDGRVLPVQLRRDVPMFHKIDVNGANAHRCSRGSARRRAVLGDAIKWNFTKFLVNREGEVVGRYAPNVPPADIEKDIRALL